LLLLPVAGGLRCCCRFGFCLPATASPAAFPIASKTSAGSFDFLVDFRAFSSAMISAIAIAAASAGVPLGFGPLHLQLLLLLLLLD
jgi:hypothetical protein